MTDARTVTTDFGTVTIHSDCVAVSANLNELSAWSHRPGAVWPCSTLEDFDNICAWFDSNGLYELQGFDPAQDDHYSTEHVDGNELTAWSKDLLELANLSADHPAYFAAVGQYKEEN